MLLCVESRGMPRQKKTMPRRCAGSIHIDSRRRRGKKSCMLIAAGISGKKSCMLIAAGVRERDYACWELPAQGKEIIHADSCQHIGKEVMHAENRQHRGKKSCRL